MSASVENEAFKRKRYFQTTFYPRLFSLASVVMLISALSFVKRIDISVRNCGQICIFFEPRHFRLIARKTSAKVSMIFPMLDIRTLLHPLFGL